MTVLGANGRIPPILNRFPGMFRGNCGGTRRSRSNYLLVENLVGRRQSARLQNFAGDCTLDELSSILVWNGQSFAFQAVHLLGIYG